MNKLKKILDKKLIWLFLLIFLMNLTTIFYYLSQYRKVEIKEEGALILNEKEYNYFLKSLEFKEVKLTLKNPFQLNGINIIEEDQELIDIEI